MAQGNLNNWCKFVIVFSYNLAFGIKFLHDYDKSDHNLCQNPPEATALWSGIYFIYTAAFNLLELILALTGSIEKAKRNKFARAVLILLELPTYLYAVAYLAILYSYGKVYHCPDIKNAIDSWVVFAYVITIIAVVCAFLTLIAFVFSFQKIKDYFAQMETTLLSTLGNTSAARKLYIWCTFIFSFTYHLVFGIIFLVKVGDTDPNACNNNIYEYAKIAGAYFLYMALYSLGDLVFELTDFKAKLNDSLLGRIFAALVLIPVCFTPLVYLKLLTLSGFDTCPGVYDAILAFFKFNCICALLFLAGKVLEAAQSIRKSEEEKVPTTEPTDESKVLIQSAQYTNI